MCDIHFDKPEVTADSYSLKLPLKDQEKKITGDITIPNIKFQLTPKYYESWLEPY